MFSLIFICVADIVFQLDDGCVSAHKAILSARSDYMVAMFNYGFRESSEKIVSSDFEF